MPQCLNPITLKSTGVHVPCGQCFNCKMNLRNSWSFRLKQELYDAESAWFITLTYDDEHIKDLNVREIQLLLKKLRKEQNKYVSDLKIKYYVTAEYGGKYGRPHYHMIIYNLVNPVLEKLINKKIWTQGHVDHKPVTLGNINYINSYHLIGKYSGNEKIKPFSKMSKGLGKRWIEKDGLNTKKGRRYYVTINKCKMKIPRYYQDKLWSIKEKEAMAEYMQEKSKNDQLKFEAECQEKKINPWKLRISINEAKRNNYLSKTNKKFKL